MAVTAYISQGAAEDRPPPGAKWPRHGVSAAASVDASHIIAELMEACRWDRDRGALIVPYWARFRVAGHLETIRNETYLCDRDEE